MLLSDGGWLPEEREASQYYYATYFIYIIPYLFIYIFKLIDLLLLLLFVYNGIPLVA